MLKKALTRDVANSGHAAEHEGVAAHDSVGLKRQLLVWLFSVLGAVFVYSCVALVVAHVYHPDIAALKREGDQLLISNTLIRPEPVEALLTRLGLLIIPLGLLGFYHLFLKSKLIARLAATSFFNVFSIACVAGVFVLGYCDFSASNPFAKGGGDIPQTRRDAIALSDFGFYFDGLFTGNHLLLYLLVICPLVACLFFIGFRKYHWDERKTFRKVANIVGYTAIATVIVCCVLMCTFHEAYQTENKYDFGAVYYSMTQVYAGSPMLVHGFTNTYGLYPHFLNPLFQVIGLSVFKFSLVMSLLMALGFTLNFYCLKQFAGNKIILFFGMFTMLFFSFLDFKFIENFDAEFALFSVRYIIPSVLFFLATVYLKRKTAAMFWAITIIMAFFVLWNPEFGIVSYAAWLLFLTFIGFYTAAGKVAIRKILFVWAGGIGALVGVIYLFKLAIYLCYGAAPDMGELWSAIFVFGKYGFNLLPMALVHPWNLMALVIVAGLMYAISRWYGKDITAKAGIVFLLSVISVGFFLYFQGRSHNWNFALSSGMAIILLTILGDELWAVARVKKIPALNMLFVLVLCAISFSGFEVVAGTGKMYALFYQEEDKAKGADEQKIIDQGKEFIAANSEPGQKIYVLTLRKFQGLFFDGEKRVSAFNPGMIDMFLNSDIERLKQQLVDSSYKVFITPYAFFNLPFMARPLAAIAATYEGTNSSNMTMVCAEKRKSGIPPDVFFSDTARQLIHRKYTNDTTGARMRIADAFGIRPVTLAPEFSVQLLFNNRLQVFPIATLVGNSDSVGFVISTNTDKAFFAINGNCDLLPLPGPGWLYCVMNVYADHFEVYVNGVLLGRDVITKPIVNTDKNISIGNMGYMHNYVGAIAEVAVANKAVDSNQVVKTWTAIRTVLTGGR